MKGDYCWSIDYWLNLLMSTCKFSHLVRNKLIGSIRFAPPLVISEEDVRKAIRIIGESLDELDKVCPFIHFRKEELIGSSTRSQGMTKRSMMSLLSLRIRCHAAIVNRNSCMRWPLCISNASSHSYPYMTPDHITLNGPPVWLLSEP